MVHFGRTKIVQADGTYLFKAGDIFLIPKHQLATIINWPKDGLPHKTVVMHLTTERLRAFYNSITPKQPGSSAGKIRRFSDQPLLKSCFDSLIPYFEMNELPCDIASLKITEAITILRLIDADIDSMLNNFETPGKIDLMDYMENHFMFNMPLEKFAYVTGRSLTTFKRDFKKVFGSTPQRWLTKKRLDLAHYQFTEKKMKPIDVCYEVGFENLSHFSFAFKKRFGYAPSALLTSG